MTRDHDILLLAAAAAPPGGDQLKWSIFFASRRVMMVDRANLRSLAISTSIVSILALIAVCSMMTSKASSVISAMDDLCSSVLK